ncbi:MAG: hypothetical protein ACU0CO_18680 [Shimia sp.]
MRLRDGAPFQACCSEAVTLGTDPSCGQSPDVTAILRAHSPDGLPTVEGS